MKWQRIQSKAPVVMLVAALLPTTILGDHLPDAKLARGKDDVILAGVEVYKTPIDQILSSFGKPTSRKEVSPATGDAVGERLYVWKKRDITIEVGTFIADQAIFKGGLRETPRFVTVDGTDGTLGRTGRGLKLGDPSSAIAEVYGTRYVKQGRRITLQWETTTTLEVRWNEEGIVNHIELLGPE